MWVAVSGVVVAVCVLDMALDAVWGVVVAANVPIVDGDVAASLGGSGCGTGGWGDGWRGLGRLWWLLDRRLVLLVEQGRSAE